MECEKGYGRRKGDRRKEGGLGHIKGGGGELEEIGTYESQRITQQDESRRMVWEFVCEALEVGVYVVVYGSYLECLLVDFIYTPKPIISIVPSLSLSSTRAVWRYGRNRIVE